MAESIDDVFADYNAPGVPSSGEKQVVKSRVRQLLKEIAGGTAAVGDFQGAWDSGTAYVARDIVESGGSLWYALQASTNSSPTEGADWTVFLPGVSVGDGAVTAAKIADSLNKTVSLLVTDRTTLKALDPARYGLVVLYEAARAGQFVWRSGDYSAQVAADPQEGVYIKADGTAASSGAWVRVRKAREVCAEWFGATPGSSDVSTAVNAAIDLLQSEGGGTLWIEHFYQTASLILVDGSDINLRGTNRSAGFYRTTTGGQVVKFTGSRHSASDLLFAMNVFTTTATDFVVWVNDLVQFAMERCKIQGGYIPLAITGGACTTTSFRDVVITYASGTSLVYMADSTAGVNGDHHFWHCTLDQAWPVVAPDGATDVQGAWASGTVYASGDIVIVGSFYLQCRVGGTSGGVAPTVNAWYGTDIADGSTVKWQLAGRVDYAAFDISTNVYYVTVRETDMTGPFQYPVILRNHLSGDVPNDIHFDDCTAHGPLSIGAYVTAGRYVYFDRYNTWSALDNTAAATYGILNAAGSDVWITRSNIYGFDRGVDIAAAKTFVQGNTIVGNTIGVRVAAGVTDFAINGNNLGSAAIGGANTTAVSVVSGASDYYTITNNLVHGAGAGVSDSGSGSNKLVSGNV